jgi:hypothetical protein
MSFTIGFKKQFAIEYDRYPSDQKEKILDFILLYKTKGLSDFSAYEGKISPSWRGLQPTDHAYIFAKGNSLWHYHIGIPRYESNHPKYKTSDWVLHFQWIDQGLHIDLVDVCYHYKASGEFYLPPESYLG